jgi:hypothetical protein
MAMNAIKIIKLCSMIAAGSAVAYGSNANETTPGFSSLSSYAEIGSKLSDINHDARRAFQYGPLIKNGHNGGLIDIDIPLTSVSSATVNQDVCGFGTNPSLRDALTCTIEAGGRGNTDSSKIGQSTQGRDILAARIGNPYGAKVMIITQQHGNEPAATEAALTVLEKWAKRRWVGHRHPLKNLDMLFVVRANPDGGEPTAACSDPLPVGAPNFNNCAFSRMNVDPSAGGGFQANTEADFNGVVGQGYNLNRYHYVDLDNAIRPVENQAMVSAALAFDPDYVLDLHGDVTKTDCELDYSTIVPGAILGQLPSIECVGGGAVEDEVRRNFSVFTDADDGTVLDTQIRAFSGKLLNRMESAAEGTVGRFAQVQLGSGTANDGVSSVAYKKLGAMSSGWETANFGLAARPDIVAFVNGVPTIAPNTAAVNFDFIDTQIGLNKKALRKALRLMSKFERRPAAALNDGAFCDFPLPSGSIGTFPTALFGPAGNDDAKMVPMDPAIGVPLLISGVCPQDGV